MSERNLLQRNLPAKSDDQLPTVIEQCQDFERALAPLAKQLDDYLICWKGEPNIAAARRALVRAQQVRAAWPALKRRATADEIATQLGLL
jgi:hypothetical protein